MLASVCQLSTAHLGEVATMVQVGIEDWCIRYREVYSVLRIGRTRAKDDDSSGEIRKLRPMMD